VVCCREMRADDVSSVVDLLTRGFARKREYWISALEQLTNHPTPAGLPKYGYVIDDNGSIVGVVLLIFTAVGVNGTPEIRCNVSSWHVEPAYRGYGSILSMRAVRRQNTTFFNVSPAPHTRTILEKQGFVQFAAGRTLAVPALNRPLPGVRVRAVEPSVRCGPDLDQAELDVLRHHMNYGCLSLICQDNTERYPFVFGTQLRFGFVPVAHLVYCRQLEDFIRFAGSIGRFLAQRGYAFVIFDSDGPVRGITGRYFGDRPRYRKGGHQIRLGDVAYSEQVIFGY
jgi:hypothetical protein